MRVLLILPGGGRVLGYPPLGLAMIASVLREYNHEVQVVDLTISKYWSTTNDGYSFKSDISNNKNSKIIAENSNSDSDVLEATLIPVIKDFSPDLVGISVHCGNVFTALKIEEIMGGLDIKVIFGGPEATENAQYLLNNSTSCLGVIRGEGEFSFLHLVNEIEKKSDFKVCEKIPGIAYIKNGRIIVNSITWPNINEISLPAWDIFDLEPYRKYNQTLVLPAQLSRGCPHKCSFCSTSNFQPFRDRPWLHFIDELEINADRYNCDIFRFADSTFNYNKDILTKVCNSILDRQINIKWGAYARVDNIDSSIASTIRRAGCKYLYLGIESGSDRILKLMRKGFKRKKIIEAISCLRNNGIKVLCSFIVGFPGETVDTVMETKSLIDDIKPDAGFVFPFESRKGTWINRLINIIGPFGDEVSLDCSDNLLSESNFDSREEILLKYGRMLSRDVMPWPRTNQFCDWWDILKYTNEIQKTMDNYISFNGEHELLLSARNSIN